MYSWFACLEWLLSTVSSLVTYERGSLSKTFVTLFTFMGAFPCMNHFMMSKGGAISVRFVTRIARKLPVYPGRFITLRLAAQ